MPPARREARIVRRVDPPEREKLRQKRVVRRQSLAAATHLPAGMSFLEGMTIQKKTREDYERLVTRFMLWAQPHGVDWDCDRSLDLAVCENSEEWFFSGATADEGGKTLAGLCYYDVGLYKCLASTLPRAHRALRGWTKIGPAEQRLPFPLVLLYPVAAWLVHHGEIDKALCLLLQHNTYMRPGEVTSLTVMQLVAPMPHARAPYDQWAVNIAPYELLKPAKTGLMDESVTIDGMDWAHDLFEILVRNRARSEPLFRFSLPELGTSFQRAVQACGLHHSRPSLYALRHGGASEDYLRRRRTLEDIQRRGRWRSSTSVRRYTKEAKLLSELHKVDENLIQYGEYVEQQVNVLFRHPHLVSSLASWRPRA